jgi:pyruvate dehydrogenase kinase 2/3/4
LRNALGPVSSPADLFSFSHVRNATRLKDSRLGALRTASLSKQGFRATVDEQVGIWQDARAESENSSLKPRETFHRRIGIGLPMSYIYAT